MQQLLETINVNHCDFWVCGSSCPFWLCIVPPVNKEQLPVLGLGLLSNLQHRQKQNTLTYQTVALVWP